MLAGGLPLFLALVLLTAGFLASCSAFLDSCFALLASFTATLASFIFLSFIFFFYQDQSGCYPNYQ